jgi:hypothetical protein
VLGKNRMASGREEAFKACAVGFGSNQEGSVLLAVFSDLGLALIVHLRCLRQCRQFGWHRMVPFVGLGQLAHLPYYGVL